MKIARFWPTSRCISDRCVVIMVDYSKITCSLSNHVVVTDDLGWPTSKCHFSYVKTVDGQNLQICCIIHRAITVLKRSAVMSVLSRIIFYYIRNSSRSFKVK